MIYVKMNIDHEKKHTKTNSTTPESEYTSRDLFDIMIELKNDGYDSDELFNLLHSRYENLHLVVDIYDDFDIIANKRLVSEIKKFVDMLELSYENTMKIIFDCMIWTGFNFSLLHKQLTVNCSIKVADDWI